MIYGKSTGYNFESAYMIDSIKQLAQRATKSVSIYSMKLSNRSLTEIVEASSNAEILTIGDCYFDNLAYDFQSIKSSKIEILLIDSCGESPKVKYTHEYKKIEDLIKEISISCIKSSLKKI